MKKIYVPYIQEVPEWEQCYYNLKTQKKILSLSQKCYQLQHNICLKLHKLLFKFQGVKDEKVLKESSVREYIQNLSREFFQIQSLNREINDKFYDFSSHEMEKICFFVQYKCFEIKEKFHRLQSLHRIVNLKDNEFISLLQNSYIEIHYLKRMIKYNQNQELACIRQYEIGLYQYETLSHQEGYSRRMNRMEKEIIGLQKSIQRIYMVHQGAGNNLGIKHLLTMGSVNRDEVKGKNSVNDVYKLGFIMGILFAILGSILFLKEYHNITLESNQNYASYFPVWRGASYFIFYQWVLGFVFLFLESTQINYKLILRFDNETVPKSISLFYSAQLMTIIFLILFFLYMLQISSIIHTNFQYFGHLMWLVLILYYLVPIPFTNYHGTMYFLKLLFQTIISVTPLIRCNPLIIWLSEQIVSFSQPFADFGYTICKLQNLKSQCLQIPTVTFIILVTFFSYRLIQNFRMFYQANWKIIPPFWGLWRALLGLITSITSYYYRKELDYDWFIVWIITAGMTTIVATFVDFKGDWGLLDGSLLRKRVCFPNSVLFYYVCMFIDFCLRANWALNISPSVIRKFNVLPYYLVMIVTYLQLFRRCMWNIFRIEFDHAKNCDHFEATINDSLIEAELKKKYLQYLKPIENYPEQDMRKKAQYQLVTSCIKSQKIKAEEILLFLQRKTIEFSQINMRIGHIFLK